MLDEWGKVKEFFKKTELLVWPQKGTIRPEWMMTQLSDSQICKVQYQAEN